MKKLIYMAGAALVMLASASCEKKETVKEAQSSVEKADMVFTATSESALKTTIVDGTKAVWSSTDNLKVFTEADQTGSVCDYKSGAGTATAEFEGQCAKKGPWTAICPAIEGATYSAGTITFTMQETQTYAANTFADGAMPCVAYSETNTFNFKHSFGILKLSLKLMEGKTGSVQSITVTDNGGKQLWGTFTVNPQTSQAATYSTGGASSVILDCGTGVALSESTATDFWIVAPEGAFEGGFEVLITSTDGMEATLSTTKANTITAGEANEMPVQLVEFKPYCKKCTYTETVTDICGNKYNLVTIGSQTWMAENMRCNKYDTSSEKKGTTLSTTSSAKIDPYYTATRDGDPAAYGYYYNWTAAMGYTQTEARKQTGAYSGTRQGICPNGFHIPSRTEFTTLETAAKGGDNKPGKHLKVCDGWNEGGNGDNETCFAALPAGTANGSSVSDVGRGAYYWSSDAYDSFTAYYRNLSYNYDRLYENSYNKYFAYSVRCLRD